MLVVDASVIVAACVAEDGREPLAAEQIVAPPLGMSEVCSVLHEMRWRREVSAEDAGLAIEWLMVAPLDVRSLSSSRDAWNIADALGRAKTYCRKKSLQFVT